MSIPDVAADQPEPVEQKPPPLRLGRSRVMVRVYHNYQPDHTTCLALSDEDFARYFAITKPPEGT